MSIHIDAKVGDIAETVLMPGDPLRAKFISENYLTDSVCFNQVRGMLGFTGFYNGKKVSVMGSGMGQPSMGIYGQELYEQFNVERIIRIGSCGAIQPELKLGDLILAMSAATDSGINHRRFKGCDFAPTATFSLLYHAYNCASQQKKRVTVGQIASSDTFYNDDDSIWKLWADFGILAIEMETAVLYTMAAKFSKEALTVLTVSDSVIDHSNMTSQQRQEALTDMIELALTTATTV